MRLEELSKYKKKVNLERIFPSHSNKLRSCLYTILWIKCQKLLTRRFCTHHPYLKINESCYRRTEE